MTRCEVGFNQDAQTFFTLEPPEGLEGSRISRKQQQICRATENCKEQPQNVSLCSSKGIALYPKPQTQNPKLQNPQTPNPQNPKTLNASKIPSSPKVLPPLLLRRGRRGPARQGKAGRAAKKLRRVPAAAGGRRFKVGFRG